jgi:NAD(P)-dependent dehydrogenase (short-subunit alcohol dehydrogenase family)
MGALEGKVAVITGGNSGIGLATARRFVKEGAYVFITGRRQAELDKAVSLIGKNVTAVQGDVSKLEDLDHLYEVVRKEKGRVDVVFANAGVVDPVLLTDSTPDTYDKHLFVASVVTTNNRLNNAQHPLRDWRSFMKYAIIGSGKIGTALGRAFARKNIEVGIANSRGPETLASLVEELRLSVHPQSVQDAYGSTALGRDANVFLRGRSSRQPNATSLFLRPIG